MKKIIREVQEIRMLGNQIITLLERKKAGGSTPADSKFANTVIQQGEEQPA